MKTKPIVVGIGELLWDIFPDGKRAGDSFSGAFLYSILYDKKLKETHENAVYIAAFVCSQQGAWPSYSGLKNIKRTI